MGKHPSTDNLKALKSSAICNIQQNKTKHEIEDLNLDGNVAEEQKTPHVFKSDLTKHRGEFITGILQHKEVDQTRAPKEKSDIKNTHSSLTLESTVALSGIPVSHNVKVKEECEDPISLSHLDITKDKLCASHQLDKQFQGFVINRNNDGHSTNTSKVTFNFFFISS